MILTNIKQFFTRNKKIFYYIGLFVFIYTLSSNLTFAATTPTEDNLAKNIATIIEALLKGISVVLGLMTYLATIFLAPEWINGSLFGLDVKFKIVWIMVSNIVYFIFAFILIWVAFMNIIGKNTDQYQLKQALPKFIVGVLIVPFSWFLVQFILSISAILTVSSLALPFDTFDQFEGTLGKVKIPTQCEINLKNLGGTGSSDSFISCDKEGEMKEMKEIMQGDAIQSIFGLISMYTYGLLTFDTIGSIDLSEFKNIVNLGDLIVKIVFDFVFVLVYSVLMITLGLVLMIRGIYIWIYIMLSPVFGLMFFFGKSEGGSGFFEKFNVKEFIALAMVPVYTMLALSFGLLFIFVTGQGLSKGSTGPSPVGIEQTDKGSVVSIGPFNLNIIGALANTGKDSTEFLNEIGGGALGVVGALILKIFGIIILRGAVMAAMRQSEITKTITQPIYDFGNQVGKIAASGPGNIPIFGGQSAKSMGTIAGKVSSHIDSREVDRASTFVGKNMKFMDNQSVAKTGEMQKIISKLNNENNLGPEQHADVLRKILKEMGSTDSIIGSKAAQEALVALADKVGAKEDIKGLSFNDRDGIASIVKKIDAKLDSRGNSVIEGTNSSTINGNELDKFMKKLNDGEVSGNNRNPDKAPSEINLNINTPKMTALMAKGTGESSQFNESDINELATILYSKVKTQGGLEKFTPTEFREKITADLDITDNDVLEGIIIGINKNAETNKVNFFKEPE